MIYRWGCFSVPLSVAALASLVDVPKGSSRVPPPPPSPTLGRIDQNVCVEGYNLLGYHSTFGTLLVRIVLAFIALIITLTNRTFSKSLKAEDYG